MFKNTVSFVATALITLGAFSCASLAAPSNQSTSVPLKRQVQDLQNTVLILQDRLAYLEKQVPPASVPLFPADAKLTNLSTNGALFMMSIDKPIAAGKGSEFVLTVVNPQSVTYTQVHFDIRVFGKDANGDPKAFKPALPISRVMPALEAGKTTQFRFAVPEMDPNNFAVAYVNSVEFGGIASPTAE